MKTYWRTDMAARPPDPPDSAALERFPLAARALRVSTARPGGLGATTVVSPPGASPIGAPSSGARAIASPRPRNNWALYLFLFLLPLQNIHTGYLPNLGGGLNFLNLGFGLSLIGAWI